MTLISDRRRFITTSGLAILATTLAPRFAFAQAKAGFTHGIASGDPRQTQVTLWTRFVADGETTLKVEVAEDEAMQKVVSTGEAAATPGMDFCAHARIAGLMPGRWYYYRFRAPDGSASPVGRTRTLPDGKPDHFRIAVFSCSNGPTGWFNAYAHAAARNDVDLAIHLGDYIYESAVVNPGAAPGSLAERRGLQPAHKLLMLADYRQRYASYRNDPDLAELHRRLPMIAVWDDHETANDSWQEGAEAHDPKNDGDWDHRKAMGVRAWREWLPMSDNWYDSYQIGDLATLFRLETRLLGRSQQLAAQLDAIFKSGGDITPKLVDFRKGLLADPNRSMMGLSQERWLADGLADSVKSGALWQVLANQVIMGQTMFPKAGSSWFANTAQMTPQVEADLANRMKATAAGVPYSMDKWDGYPAARDRLYAAARAAKANLVTLTGDSHNAWAFNLGDKAGPVGVEFAGQSVSSNGLERRFTGDPLKIAADYVAANPGLRWMDTSQRGYFLLDIGRDRVESEFVFLPAGKDRNAIAAGTKKVVAEHKAKKLSI
ncbi:MAG TPA: alkaline phosphatase D family protein [Hyphomonadaceae bacterium]|nr:alkaline phosphatase D family protein [Hyphomonadaceae bacterium]